MKAPLTRRAAVAGIVAIAPASTSVAMPVVPVYPVKDDPAFAAVEHNRSLFEEVERLTAAVSEAENAAAETFGYRPVALILWRGYMIVGGEIDHRREVLLAEGKLDPRTVEREYRKMKAREQARLDAERNWDERSDVAPLRRELEETRTEQLQNREPFSKTRPTTLAGAAAMIRHVVALIDEYDGECREWHRDALATVADALSEMA